MVGFSYKVHVIVVLSLSRGTVGTKETRCGRNENRGRRKERRGGWGDG